VLQTINIVPLYYRSLDEAGAWRCKLQGERVFAARQIATAAFHFGAA
jgi:hypothetical protein